MGIGIAISSGFLLHRSTMKLYSLLAQTAIRKKLTIPYRLWSVMREIDSGGKGWLTLEQLRDKWPQAKSTIKKVLNRGEGIFWRQHKSNFGLRIYLIGLEKVCVGLGTEVGDVVVISLDDTRKLKKFRAACYGSFFVNKRTIGRETLSNLYDTSKPTMISWEKTIHMGKQRNIATVTPPSDEAHENYPSRNQPGVWSVGKSLFWQLPNTYTCSLSRAASPKKTASNVRYTLSNVVEAPTYLRRYWTDGLAAYKAANKGRTAENYYVRTKTTYSTTVVWNSFFS